MKEFSAKYPIVFGAALVLVSLFAATPIALLLTAIGVAEPLASGIARLVIAAVLIALFRDELSWENAGAGLRWALPALGFVAWNVIYYCVGGAEPVGGMALVGAFVVALSSAILEELIFRGILIPRLRANGESARWSLWASTLLFCLAQLSNALTLTMGDFIVELGYALAIGLLFGAVYLKTGDLASVMGAHLLINLSGQVFATHPSVGAAWVYVLFFALLAGVGYYSLRIATGIDEADGKSAGKGKLNASKDAGGQAKA